VELTAIAEAARGANDVGLGAVAEKLDRALEEVAGATEALLMMLAAGKIDEALAGATPYLRAFGLTLGGAYLTKGVLAGRDAAGAAAAGDADAAVAGDAAGKVAAAGTAGAAGAAGAASDGRTATRLALARFFADNHLGEVGPLADSVCHGGKSVIGAAPELFAV
jgi:hypothetical protein